METNKFGLKEIHFLDNKSHDNDIKLTIIQDKKVKNDLKINENNERIKSK